MSAIFSSNISLITPWPLTRIWGQNMPTYGQNAMQLLKQSVFNQWFINTSFDKCERCFYWISNRLTIATYTPFSGNDSKRYPLQMVYVWFIAIWSDFVQCCNPNYQLLVGSLLRFLLEDDVSAYVKRLSELAYHPHSRVPPPFLKGGGTRFLNFSKRGGEPKKKFGGGGKIKGGNPTL